MSEASTIYALSSGHPPAAIAIVRISGSAADAALQQLAGTIPPQREARLVWLRNPTTGEKLDHALILRFPGPNSATGEDMAELHLHGGRSVVAAVLETLATLEGLRLAEPGEFTRRGFENGRLDLTEAEGLADLLMAETQSQRRAALALAGGAVSRMVGDWQARLLGLAARLEAVLDFSDEGEVGELLPAGWSEELDGLVADIRAILARPPVERLRDGLRVVIAGPPNVGKSSLLNALVGRDAAITSAIAGTTRDLVEAPAAIAGAPFLLIDTAGLRDSQDEVENIGIGKAWQSLALADLILWLGRADDCPEPDHAIIVRSKADLGGPGDSKTDVSVSARTGEGMDRLLALLVERAGLLLPQEGEASINARHREALAETVTRLREAQRSTDLLVVSESLRQARTTLDRITGRAGVEDMLDTLFGRFCLGK